MGAADGGVNGVRQASRAVRGGLQDAGKHTRMRMYADMHTRMCMYADMHTLMRMYHAPRAAGGGLQDADMHARMRMSATICDRAIKCGCTCTYVNICACICTRDVISRRVILLLYTVYIRIQSWCKKKKQRICTWALHYTHSLSVHRIVILLLYTAYIIIRYTSSYTNSARTAPEYCTRRPCNRRCRC